MRNLIAACITLLVFVPCAAVAAPIPCSDIPAAQAFVDKLRPGPNTRAAQAHLDAARHAGSEAQCSTELSAVDKYARRSAAADKRHASHHSKVTRHSRHQVGHRNYSSRCADALHQNRPGGSDYRGSANSACKS